jgi:hypothetical protein
MRPDAREKRLAFLIRGDGLSIIVSIGGLRPSVLVAY